MLGLRRKVAGVEELRFNLIQARGAPARIDAPLWIDVHRDGPEPVQLRQGLAILSAGLSCPPVCQPAFTFEAKHT